MIRNVGGFRKLSPVPFFYDDETTGPPWSTMLALAGWVYREIDSKGGAYSELHVDQMITTQWDGVSHDLR